MLIKNKSYAYASLLHKLGLVTSEQMNALEESVSKKKMYIQ